MEARRKFAGLLPEVVKRRLHEKKGFSSIYEFAAKLAGLSREQVDLVLRLEQKFEDKPVLQRALTQGEISPNKLVRIASIATSENQEELCEKIKTLSNRAVETFVKDVKNQSPNGCGKPLFEQKSLHVQTLKLDEDVEMQLAQMQQKGIDINEFLRNALKKREEDLENEKVEIAKEQIVSRREYIPAKIKKIIKKEHGTKCSIAGCTKHARVLHHTQRFALAKNHDPHFIAPLCEAHHEIAHKIDLKYAQAAVGNWKAVFLGLL